MVIVGGSNLTMLIVTFVVIILYTTLNSGAGADAYQFYRNADDSADVYPATERWVDFPRKISKLSFASIKVVML